MLGAFPGVFLLGMLGIGWGIWASLFRISFGLLRSPCGVLAEPWRHSWGVLWERWQMAPGVLAKCWRHSSLGWLPLRSLGALVQITWGIVAKSWRNPGGIVGRRPWIILVPKSLGQYLTTSLGCPLAILQVAGGSWVSSLESSWCSLSECLGCSAKSLRDVWWRPTLGKSCMLPGGPRQVSWGILMGSWPNPGGILGRLPWRVLAEVVQNPWGVLQGSSGHALADGSAGLVGDCLGRPNGHRRPTTNRPTKGIVFLFCRKQD